MLKKKKYNVNEIDIGYHPKGYRIDKTASPINYYTKWKMQSGRKWVHPKPVSFFSLPQDGWTRVDKFDWDNAK